MTMDELMRRVLEICPNATFSEDVIGEIVIHTNLCESFPDGSLVEMDN